MRHGVAAIGLLSWDRFLVTEHYPGPGEYAVVRAMLEQPGGTTGNTCDALARIGVDVVLASVVGADAEGEALIESLQSSGCDTRHVVTRSDARSDTGVIVVSGPTGLRDRTIFWIQGVKPLMGDHLPVDEMLQHEWVLLDIDDPRLRNFFLDLPAHRSPRTRLIGTMTYLVEMLPADAWGHVLRHDIVVGNARELQYLTQAASLDRAIEVAQRDLVGAACRALLVTRGDRGSISIRPGAVVEVPAFQVEVVDTTGAGDAFVAGCLWGLLDGCDDRELLRRGNALGGLACRALGARAALPTIAEVEALLYTGSNG
jgi:sugar/nucleoside kinase (ribokinase family)